jgi:hypothetical protein
MCARWLPRFAPGLRAEADTRNEKINYKIREHSLGKVPVILALGAREVEGRTVSLRRLGDHAPALIILARALEVICPDISRGARPGRAAGQSTRNLGDAPEWRFPRARSGSKS